MNLICKVTLESMKRNKRRTLITILGVIISVAMVSGVSTISSSMLDIIRRSSIQSGGDWHIQYNYVPSDSMQYLNDDEITSKVVSNGVGYAKLGNIKNPMRPYMYINAYEDGCMDQLPIQLTEGRYPQNDQEIMIPMSVIEAGNSYYVGEEITVDVGDRWIKEYDDQSDDRFIDQNYSYQKKEESLVNVTSKTYTITGIFNDQSLNQYQAGYEVITGFQKGLYQPNAVYSVKLKMKDVSKSIYAYGDQKAEELESDSYYYNNTLLMAYGVNSDDGLLNMMNMVIFIVGCLILLGSVSLIYNAFAISLTERSRYLGMLSSVGATKRQKRNSVFYEAFVIGCIAIPLGFLSGYVGMWITFQCVDGILMNTILEGIFSNLHLRLIIDFKSFLAAFLFSASILFISAWIPAIRASKISPIDAIRQSNDVQIKARYMKTLKWTRTIFGFEAELALKNMKRNKSRYIATLFSLIMSIVLFLGVSSFQEYISKSFSMTSNTVSSNVNAQIVGYDGSDDAQSYVKELMNVEGVQSSEQTIIFRYNTDISQNKISDDITKYSEDTNFNVTLVAYDDATFEQYCTSIGVDAASLQTNALQGILVNQRTYKIGHEFEDIEVFNQQLGNEFPLVYFNQSKKELETSSIPLTAITKISEPIISNQNRESLNEVTIVLSRQAMDAFLQEKTANNAGLFVNSNIYFQGDDAAALETTLLHKSEQQPLYMTQVMNRENEQRQQQQLLLFISIFLYGFVALMLLVSGANIFNTISTGVMLRKQEFAMLKSVGITPKGFRKMLTYENLFYAIKSLLYGIPISSAFSYLLYIVLNRNFSFSFFLPWKSICIAFLGIFALVLLTMLYAIHKVKHDNIVETIRNESI